MGVSGQLCPRPPCHYPHLHGPADQCCHCQPQGKQIEGLQTLIMIVCACMSINDFFFLKKKILFNLKIIIAESEAERVKGSIQAETGEQASAEQHVGCVGRNEDDHRKGIRLRDP